MMKLMSVQTLCRSMLREFEPLDIRRLPLPLAVELRRSMGAPSVSDDKMSRFHGILHGEDHAPRSGCAPYAAAIPFDLVICHRGASLRCRMDLMDEAFEAVSGLLPALTIIPMPGPSMGACAG